MPITASINRHPETENESQNAPHPEEMKATFDLAIRQCRADNPGRLGGSGIACCRGAIPGGFTCKETAGRKTSSVIASAKRRKLMERVFIGATRAEATRMADEPKGPTPNSARHKPSVTRTRRMTNRARSHQKDTLSLPPWPNE
jgi:hypothetical protein